MLTLDNLANESQYTNTRSTFDALLAYGVVPVVNENDTVAVDELRLGDNDTLSAKVGHSNLDPSQESKRSLLPRPVLVARSRNELFLRDLCFED